MTVLSRPSTGPIYLDYNATTPIDPAVTASLLPYVSDEFGNPSSGHHYGRKPRTALAAAAAVAVSPLAVSLLAASPDAGAVVLPPEHAPSTIARMVRAIKTTLNLLISHFLLVTP